jgi:primosomal protein N''
LDARLLALQELLGVDRSRALREAIHSDKRGDYAHFAKLAANYRQIKRETAAASLSQSTDTEVLHSRIAQLEEEIQASCERRAAHLCYHLNFL